MKTLVLDGFNEHSDIQARTMEAVTSELAGRGLDARVLTLREMELAPCTGCFGCWTKRPGMCVQEDHSHELCRKIVESELLLTVTPVTFGGYSSTAKAAMDRTIGLVSPFFTMVGKEVHHKPRYERMPAIAVLGINHGDCDRCPEIFRTLIYRNAINFHLPAMAVDVAEVEDFSGDGYKARVAGLLDQILSTPMSEFPVKRICREDFAARSGVQLPPPSNNGARRLLVLTGSPKVKSTSSALGGELAARLIDRGWQTETLKVLPSLGRDDSWQRLADAMENADLVALVTPLYVDSLPAPVTAAFERIARQRGYGSRGRKPGFMAILNCGFPEDFHNYTGLAIARQFADEAGYMWMGGLALGMGGAIDGRPLADCGRMVRNVVKALDLTASALDRGEPISSEAVDLMAREFFPRWLYIVMGNWGWKRQARKYGVRQELFARPYYSVQPDKGGIKRVGD